MNLLISKPTGTALLRLGPSWTSFEEFRKQGSSALESIQPRTAATMMTKAGVYRVMRDEDFQYLVGLASEIHRVQSGMKFVYQAAKVARSHPDSEHLELLMQSLSLIGQSPELPQRAKHDSFELTPEEVAAESSDDLDLSNTEIPRPKW
jgi:hypothetical protein